MVNPGNNIVSIVDFYITYDPTKLDVLSIKESTAFPAVVRATSLSAGAANMSVSVGADVTKAVQATSKVATISFKPKVAGPVQLQFDSTKSRVFSLAPADQPTENVLSSATSSTATISSDACTPRRRAQLQEQVAPTRPQAWEVEVRNLLPRLQARHLFARTLQLLHQARELLLFRYYLLQKVMTLTQTDLLQKPPLHLVTGKYKTLRMV